MKEMMSHYWGNFGISSDFAVNLSVTGIVVLACSEITFNLMHIN